MDFAIFLAFHSINQVWLLQVDKAKDDFCLQLYREAQNKLDYSTFRLSLQKFAQNNAFNTCSAQTNKKA